MTNTIGEIADLLEQLRLPDRERREEAMARLADAGPAGLAAVREGLSHPHWRVRRNRCRFLDHHVDPDFTEALIGCLTDRNRKVRQQALHALSCDACKPGQGPTDHDIIEFVIERLQNDPSVRVRRHASISLLQLKDEQRVREALHRALADPDPIVQRNAGWGVGS